MSNLFKKALELIVGNEAAPSSQSAGLTMPKTTRPLKALTERQLLQLESQIGAAIFGELPPKTVRSFFNLDETTWVWHEETVDEAGKHVVNTIRYEVQKQGVLKVQEGARYSYIEGVELNNFIVAVQQYYERVMREIYHRDPKTGQKSNNLI